MDPQPRRDLGPAIEASLKGKIERLLSRPIIAEIAGSRDDAGDSEAPPDTFLALQNAARHFRTGSADAWGENPADGRCTIHIFIDYDEKWRGREKEIQQAVSSSVERAITFLTDAQRSLLARSPESVP
jgi:hypothetical protein